ncbi:CynX/NimT family MFS transporter [Paraburkholderia bannensis]|uniref:CynX/NimT family MFS transporter n=1 Tax=Paraburkholderia bannensis TaxID=765414 RepID=UPI002ABE1F62|nr:MFS transporter [Paraburkholderia bannensis]
MNNALPKATLLRRSNLFLPLGIVLIGANLRAPITALGPVLSDIQSELALGDTTASLLSALPLLIFALLSLVAPAFGRAFGLERSLGIALVGILIGTIVRSCPFAGGIWVGTLLLSCGIAIGNVLLPGLVKRAFPDHATLYIGVYAAAMASTAGISAGLAAPVAEFPGSNWRIAIALGVVITAAALLIWLPQMRYKHVSGATHGNASSAASPWRHPIGWQVSSFFAFQSFVFYSLVTWYAAMGQTHGESATSSGFDLLLYQVIAVATNLLSAPVIKRTKDQRAIGFACGACLFIGTVGLGVAAPYPTLWLAIAGLGAGFSMTTSLSLFALRTRHHDQAAKLSGMAQFVGYAGAALGPVLSGMLHGVTGSWTASLVMLVGASLMVTVFAVLSGRNRFID